LQETNGAILTEYIILVIGCLLSIIGTLIVWQFKGMRSDIHNMSLSVTALNQQIGIVITDQKWQQDRLAVLEKRFNQLTK